MTQREDESLEDLVDRFIYNVKRTKSHDLGLKKVKKFLLKATRDEWIVTFNQMGKGDVS